MLGIIKLAMEKLEERKIIKKYLSSKNQQGLKIF